MFRRVFILVFVLFLMGNRGLYAQDVSAEEKAVLAAQTWVELIDNGQYAASWEEAAKYFKEIVKKEAWTDSIQPLRASLGKVLTRNLKDYQFVTALPGAPDGKYVVIQFDTSFENKEAAVETVTPMIDVDGQWRVSGYYIK